VAFLRSGGNEYHTKQLSGQPTSGPRVEAVAFKYGGRLLNEMVASPTTSQEGKGNTKNNAEAVTQQSKVEKCIINLCTRQVAQANLHQSRGIRLKRSQQLELYKIRFKSHYMYRCLFLE
jgi:hypothetical protein